MTSKQQFSEAYTSDKFKFNFPKCKSDVGVYVSKDIHLGQNLGERIDSVFGRF